MIIAIMQTELTRHHPNSINTYTQGDTGSDLIHKDYCLFLDLAYMMSLWNTDAPIYGKTSRFYILTTSHPRGPWCKLYVRNLWVNFQSKFGYCIAI